MKSRTNRFLQAIICTMLTTPCSPSLLGCNQCDKQKGQRNPSPWHPTKQQQKELDSLLASIDELAKNRTFDKVSQNKMILRGIALLRWKSGTGKPFEQKIQKMQCHQNLKDALLKDTQRQFTEIVDS